MFKWIIQWLGSNSYPLIHVFGTFLELPTTSKQARRETGHQQLTGAPKMETYRIPTAILFTPFSNHWMYRWWTKFCSSWHGPYSQTNWFLGFYSSTVSSSGLKNNTSHGWTPVLLKNINLHTCMITISAGLLLPLFWRPGNSQSSRYQVKDTIPVGPWYSDLTSWHEASSEILKKI